MLALDPSSADMRAALSGGPTAMVQLQLSCRYRQAASEESVLGVPSGVRGVGRIAAITCRNLEIEKKERRGRSDRRARMRPAQLAASSRPSAAMLPTPRRPCAPEPAGPVGSSASTSAAAALRAAAPLQQAPAGLPSGSAPRPLAAKPRRAAVVPLAASTEPASAAATTTPEEGLVSSTCSSQPQPEPEPE